MSCGECGECDVISLYFMCFSINGSVCLVCCVYDNVCELLVKQFTTKQFTICLGLVAILLLNIMEVFSVGGGALLDRVCMVI